jgi:hypothetical protein
LRLLALAALAALAALSGWARTLASRRLLGLLLGRRLALGARDGTGLLAPAPATVAATALSGWICCRVGGSRRSGDFSPCGLFYCSGRLWSLLLGRFLALPSEPG